MKTQTPAKLAEPIPSDIKDILGPPPILTTEDDAIYYAMLSCFAQDIAPRDIIAWIYIKDAADHRVEIARFRRLKAGIIQSAYEKRTTKEIEYVNLQAATQREQLRKKAALEKQTAAPTIANKNQLEKREAEIEAQLKKNLSQIESDRMDTVQELQSRAATDRDLCDELDNWMHHFQKLEQLQEVAEKRFVATIRDLERHVGGFGKTLQENLSKIIEGEVVSRDSAEGPRSEK
jgi:hypothetical protein